MKINVMERRGQKLHKVETITTLTESYRGLQYAYYGRGRYRVHNHEAEFLSGRGRPFIVIGAAPMDEMGSMTRTRTRATRGTRASHGDVGRRRRARRCACCDKTSAGCKCVGPGAESGPFRHAHRCQVHGHGNVGRRRKYMRSYYTVIVPHARRGRTVWHPNMKTGPFSTLSRGHFRTQREAHAWAKKHLKGTHYRLKRVKHVKE